MHTTPWTSAQSSLPSDRIRPNHSQRTQQRNSKPKGQQRSSNEPQKSRDVLRLESLLKALQRSRDSQDPHGGCFCLARKHSLSTYVPMCPSCGLILCSVNLPQYCCPHCLKPVATAATKASLVERVELQIAQTLAKELEERERAAEAERRAVGEFPALSAQTRPPQQSPAPQSTIAGPDPTRKVLSLNSRTKKVTVSSYNSSPAASRPQSRAESEEGVDRVPPPPSEPVHAVKAVSSARPWENLLCDGSPTYLLPGGAAGKNRKKGQDTG